MMFQSENKVKNLCALEVAESGAVTMFIRSGDKVEKRMEQFRPFLLMSAPDFLCDMDGDVNVTKLEGGDPYQFLATFGDLVLYDKAVKLLKQVTGFNASAPGAPYRLFTDMVQQALMAKDMRLFDGMTFPQIRRMQFDIETLCSPEFDFPNPKREEDRIIIISMSDSTGWEKAISLEDHTEKELLEEFVATVRERDPDILEGHNIFRFDLPYIEERAKRHKVRLQLGRDGSVPAKRNSRISIAERTVNYTRYDIYGRHVADTFHLLLFYDAIHRSLESYNLKYAAKHFGVAAPDRTYVEGAEISAAWEKDRENLLKYALDDVRETRALSAILSPSYFYQAQLVPISYQNCIVRGNATRIDALLASEYLKAGHALPAPERGRPFSGALTRALDSGVFENIDHCDVRSLYPSIILSEQWTPGRDSLGVFPRLLERLRTFRLNAKDSAKNAKTAEEKDYYSALQSTFKILINSFYGYLGFEQGFLNDYDMAERVTTRGREILTLMLDTLESSGAKIIEMDTDGIYFQVQNGTTPDSIGAALKKALPEGIEVDFDESYKAMFCYKSKNYALLHADGRMSITGAALKSRGLEPFQRRYMETIIHSLLTHDQKTIRDTHDYFVKAIANHELPLRDLAKSENLSDSLETYKRKMAAGGSRRSAAYELAIASGRDYRQGDQVTFYITGEKKKVSVVENSKLLSDAKEGERDENVAYYLDKLEELRKKFAPFLEDGGEPDLFS